MAYVKPKKMLYISIDGVAPRAKINGQRERRFGGAQSHFKHNVFYLNEEEELEGDADLVFDGNSITPGTEFMYRLDMFLRTLVKFKLSSGDPLWKSKKVIYSNYQRPGEGEQKIFEYLRLHKKDVDESHVIYSPDADLIFLGLTLPNYKIKIMKEVDFFQSNGAPLKYRDFMQCHFVYVDENLLSEFIVGDLQQKMEQDFDYKRVLADFVLLCFCVGNDFLPCAPCFEIKVDAIEKIIEYLGRTIAKCNNYITREDGKLNFDALKQFFAECEHTEIQDLRTKREHLRIARKRGHVAFDPHVEFDVTTPEGKKEYYAEKMNVKSDADLNAACHHYIKGMLWIYKYYFFGCADWNFSYGYYFAPFMAELKNTVMNESEMNFDLHAPIKPFEQLLSVMPSTSMHLLPPSYRGFFYENKNLVEKAPYTGKLSQEGYIKDFNAVYDKSDNPDLEVCDVFDFTDVKFEIDGFMKEKKWQFIDVLPFLDYDAVLEYSKKVEGGLTGLNKERNTEGVERIYALDLSLIEKEKELNPKVGDMMKETSQTTGQSEDCLGRAFQNKAVEIEFDQQQDK